jgi:hypothetical protein
LLTGKRFGRGGRRRFRCRPIEFIRKAVDRLVAEERIDPGIAIEGEKLARVSV